LEAKIAGIKTVLPPELHTSQSQPSQVSSLPLVIPTEAYSDFLLRTASNATGAALRRESRMQLPNATGLDRKSGGAQWRDLRFSGPLVEMFLSKQRMLDCAP
jgi:hypothetical protein